MSQLARQFSALLFLLTATTVMEANELPVGKAPDAPESKVTISGKLALPREIPDGVNLEKLDLSKLTGTLQRMLPPPKLPQPEGYDEWPAEKKRVWLKEWVNSAEFMTQMPMLAQWRAEQRAVEPVPLPFQKDGSFHLEGLTPGEWVLEARIPHPSLKESSYATFTERLSLTADQNPFDIGEHRLNLHVVLAPDDIAPDFIATNFEGQEFKLSDYRGKYVLVDFWATWCVPCVASLPDVEAVYNEYHGENFEVIGLNLDKSIDIPKAFQEKYPASYVQGYARDHDESQAVASYGIESIPSIWLIGPDGEIVARDLRAGGIRTAVKNALKRRSNPKINQQ